jgi:WD40 repeat protein
MKHAALDIHDGWIKSLDIDAFGALIASSSTDNSVKFTDIKSRQLLATLAHEHTAEALRFSREQPYIFMAMSNGIVRLYDLVDREYFGELYGHASAVRCLSVSGREMVTGSADRTIRHWDIRTRGCTGVIKAHGSAVNEVLSSGDFLIYSCSMDGTVKMWDSRGTGTTIAEIGSSVGSMCLTQAVLYFVGGGSLYKHRDGATYPVPGVDGAAVVGSRGEECVVGGNGYLMIGDSRVDVPGTVMAVRCTTDIVVCGGTSKRIEIIEAG